MSVFRPLIPIALVLTLITLMAACGSDSDTVPVPDVADVPDVTPDTTPDVVPDVVPDSVPDVSPDVPETNDGGPDVPEVAEEISEDTETTPPPPSFSIAITSPSGEELYEFGSNVDFAAKVSTTGQTPLTDFNVSFSSNLDEVLMEMNPAEDGTVSFSTDTLSAGSHLITATAQSPTGETASDNVWVGVCTWSTPELFDVDIEGSGWTVYGDGYWDNDGGTNGWLEMTGIEQSSAGKQGAIFNTTEKITPQDVHISFKIATGGGVSSSWEGGADGFAMSIIDAASITELESIVTTPASGGCLGYGVASPACGGLDITAFHIEFDTFPNNNNPISDPSPASDHIGVMLNGDAGTHHLYAALPDIEDLEWHDVTVEINGTTVRVTFDGNEVINGELPNLDFRGGYIGFSGTTGGKTNYHRFDELEITQQCLVQ